MGSSKRSWLLQEFSAHNVGLSASALGKKSGRVMATGGEDGQVNLWAVGKPSCVMKFTGHTSAVEALTFNSSEELVCAGSRSGQLRIWNIAEGKVTRYLSGHKAAVTCVDFLSLGEFVASGSLDHKVKMWDCRRRGCIFSYTGHEGAINALQFSPDGRWISSSSDDGVCKIWDLSTGKLLHQFSDHGAPVTSLQFHPNELLLATGGKDKTLKVYDVEQFKMVSSSKPQASAVHKVIFSESGHCVYAISQDMCHAYVWEPQPRNTDSLMVKWGRPSDVVVSAKQLISTSINHNIVANHIIDLTQVKTSPFELPNTVHPFEPPATLTPFTPADSVTQRPQSTSNAIPVSSKTRDAPNTKPAVKPEIKFNNHNIQSSINPDDIFNPKNTLTRSPESRKPASISLAHHEPRVQHFKPSPSTPHQATNILPHLTPDQPVPEKIPPPISRKDSPPDPPKQPAPTPATSKTSVDEPPYSANEVPTRDRPDADDNLEQKTPKEDVVKPADPQSASTSLDDTRLSTIVPSNREDAVGLDMNAFLPPKKEPIFTMEKKSLSDEEAISNISRGFDSMRIVLMARHKNLEVVRAMWTGGDVMTAMNTAVRMKDQALLVDLFTVLNLKKSLWSLDLCQILLPEILDLITSKYETYVTAACGALKVVLQTFGQVIKSNVTAYPSVGVDISREERYKKCRSCNEIILQIRPIVESKLQTPGKIGTSFRELNILVGSIFD